jgi:myo-inositol-1(or 4)-monophosphatase
MQFVSEKQVGLNAANEAGQILSGYFGKARVVRKKGRIDLVTEADTASEKAIVSVLRGAFPDDAVLAEEGGQIAGRNQRVWIVDPLDGTTNYAHGVPVFAVSIAFAENGETVLGIVANPVSGELFVAVKGQGATLNGNPVCVSGVSDIEDSLLVTGFPYSVRENPEPVLGRLSRALGASQGVRRLGSAALDLCWVACGRYEGFWEENLAPWDTAAGELIVREAGGRVTDFSGNAFKPEMKEILATNSVLHDAIKNVLNH